MPFNDSIAHKKAKSSNMQIRLHLQTRGGMICAKLRLKNVAKAKYKRFIESVQSKPSHRVTGITR